MAADTPIVSHSRKIILWANVRSSLIYISIQRIYNCLHFLTPVISMLTTMGKSCVHMEASGEILVMVHMET